eukprot:891813_1
MINRACSYGTSHTGTTIDLLCTQIQCDNIEEEIENYIESFWRQHTKEPYANNPKIGNVRSFQYNSKVKYSNNGLNDDKTYLKKKKYKVLLNVDIMNEYDNNKAIDIAAGILTGERNKEIHRLILPGYLRDINLPRNIYDLCVQYHGKD